MADSLFSSIVGGGLSMYDKMQDRSKLPANKRVFLESMLDKERTPITESKLSKSEQDALKELVWTKYSVLADPLTKYKSYLEKLTTQKDAKLFYSPDQLAQAKQDLKTVNSYFEGKITPDLLQLANLNKGTNVNSTNLLREAGVDYKQFNLYPNIQYENYGSSPGEAAANFSVSAGNTNGKSSIQTLLGRFNFDVDKQGNLKIKDTYDFNKPEQSTMAEGRYEAAGAMGPYQVLREYAGEQMPQGQGRNVNISVPLEPLQYRDPFGFTIK
jgi:hypothetical protein